MSNPDNIALSTMQMYAYDMFTVLEQIKEWRESDDPDSVEFDTFALSLLDTMKKHDDEYKKINPL